VSGASVPEATLDENHPSVGWEDEIDRCARNPIVTAIPNPVTTKSQSQDSFGTRVLSPDLRHNSAALRGRNSIGHVVTGRAYARTAGVETGSAACRERLAPLPVPG
jgi:hypothetical protein